MRNLGVRQKDETGWRVNGKRSWLWCFGTKTDAYYVIDRSRGGNVVNDVLGEFFEGVSVCSKTFRTLPLESPSGIASFANISDPRR